MKLIKEESGSGQRSLKKIASKEIKNREKKIITAVRVSGFIYK